VPDTNISPQGSGKQFMTKGYVKVGSNGNGSNGSNGSNTAVMEVVKADETAVIEEAVVVEEVKEDVKEEVKAPAPIPAPVMKTVPAMTLEQKLEKVEELNRIIKKYELLNVARKNLNQFKVGTDGLNVSILIKDAAGNEFKTSHNVVVETVLTTVRQILNERIKDTEKDINFSD
jgi:hypothetical protein